MQISKEEATAPWHLPGKGSPGDTALVEVHMLDLGPGPCNVAAMIRWSLPDVLHPDTSTQSGDYILTYSCHFVAAFL